MLRSTISKRSYSSNKNVLSTTITTTTTTSKRFLKSVSISQASLSTDEVGSSAGNKDYNYTKFFTDLKSYESGLKRSYKKLPNTSVHYSSPNDDIYRSLNSRIIVKQWSLLEACISTKDYLRAQFILDGLYNLCCDNKSDLSSFLDGINQYLASWSIDENVSMDDLSKWMVDVKSKYPLLVPNDRTFAILINSSINKSKQNQNDVLNNDFIHFILEYKKSSNTESLKEVLKHLDIFGLENVRYLKNHYNISFDEIPRELHEFFEALKGNNIPIENINKKIIEKNLKINDEEEKEEKEEIISAIKADVKSLEQDGVGKNLNTTSTEYFANDDIEIPTLRKDSETLKGVDTFGLKVIRHSLLGLTSKNKLQMLKDFQERLGSNEILPSSITMYTNTKNDELLKNDIDFYHIYRTLQNGKQREVFDAVLEEFNLERQRSLEVRSIDAASEKWKHTYEMLAKNNIMTNHDKNINYYLYKWYVQAVELVKEEVQNCKNLKEFEKSKNLTPEQEAQHKDREIYGPYLTLVSPEKMSTICILELLKVNAASNISSGVRTARSVLSVGRAVELEYRAQELLKSENDIYKTYRSIKKTSEFKKLVTKSTDEKFRKLLNRAKKDLSNNQFTWSPDIRAKVGSVLISLLLQVAKIQVNGTDPTTNKKVTGEVPAFYHSYQYVSGSRIGVIRFHPDFEKKLTKEDMNSAIAPQGLPMLVKPRPWENYNSGGYLYSSNQILRSKDSIEQQEYLKAVSEKGLINSIYQGLNVLGDTAWTVNERLFKIIVKVWNTGEPYLEIPGIVSEPQYPPPPPRDVDPSIRRKWKVEVQNLANEFSKNRSLRCDANYKLEIARAFLGEKIYFPHNLDFRGRAYPLSPHFNHLGNDLSRSLLIFWKGKELGEGGLDWLKVHLSNLFGFDKVPLEDRINFVNENMENLKDSVMDPLNGKGWWKKADKPWQALSTMFEIYEATQLPDPSKYLSHQPVHQDGTCNGLQHYAALGGDIEGAKQVNLAPSDRPQDVYSYVAGLVQKRVDLDAANGVEDAIKVQDKIKRKVVKQTVMTSVYGVTFVGAKEQIARQLVDHFPDELDLKFASEYLARQVFASIRELFEAAHLIQDWLAESAKRITKSVSLDVGETDAEFLSSVIWTTPLGLPIVQPYRSMGKKQVHTNLQTVYITDPFAITPVDSRKQMAAFPPNFIHSLDACHMLLSAVKCNEANLDFASVHDSYWTHACDIDKMNEILRKTFISLHEVDLIAKLKDEFDRRYKGFLQVISISKKTEVAKKIIELRKELSAKKGAPITSSDELHLERERQALLKSDDLEKQKMGQQMITTISLIENEDLSTLKSKTTSDTLKVFAPFKLDPIPSKGDFDVKGIKDSTYFFS
ncbi:hypothetical protein PACTADRAFT_49985 [Pachysolen tannophilus NRRL Y-2460]|uniref:DNA-directed RNA polymerase n=1 Tax=Pachysolen tannophilus NRRL Y-2460 TaxID=669874 RepID=A0A1E4TU21_PACTA|nr:hypothetical protein PACTADRAFT_49985 [Pachysolen tannophilus NRRL Y-2460]